MTRMLAMLFVGLMALGPLGVAQAADSPRTDPGIPLLGAEQMFEHFDTNQDGRIVLDEIPDSTPDFLKRMLQRADQNEDGVVTLEELQAVFPRGPRPDSARSFWRQPPVERASGPPETSPRGERERAQDASPDARRKPADRPQAAPIRRPTETTRAPRTPAPARQAFDPQAWFEGMDRDKDGKLSPEEFAAGMRLFHRWMTSPEQPRAAAPRATRERQPARPGPSARPPRATGPWGPGPGARGPWQGGPWQGGRWGAGPWQGGPWGRAPMTPPRAGGPRGPGHGGWHWGQPPMAPGRPGWGAGLPAEQRAEIAKQMERARQQAEAAWKRAATMRDQIRRRWAQQQEAKPDLQRDRDRAPRVEPEEPTPKKEATRGKKQPKQPKAKPAGD